MQRYSSPKAAITHGARIAGAPVLGPLAAMQDKAVRSAATHLVIAIPSLRGSERKRLFALCGETGLPVLTVVQSPCQTRRFMKSV